MENNHKIDVLKDLYNYSNRVVLFTDYNFNVNWTNSDEYKNVDNCAKLLNRNNNEILESGEYNTKINGLTFSYKLIKYPNINDGIYIVEISDKDILFTFINFPELFDFLDNKIATIRESVFEIVTSNNILDNCLEENYLYDERKYLNLNVNSCFKMLRSVMNILEIARYADCKKNLIELKKVDASKNINSFLESCRSILRSSSLIIKGEIEPELFIKTDLDRFMSVLIATFIYVMKNQYESDVIIYKVNRVGGYIVITMLTESLGSGESSEALIDERKARHNVFSEGNSLDSEERVISCYCNEFDATFISSYDKEHGDMYSFRMKACDENNSNINLNSPATEALNNRFSKFHIALSQIVNYKFY